MSQQNSILDKIIQSKQMQEASQFDPNEIISNLIKNLSLKERDVLSRRFGLSGQEKETLEQIGKHYQITRERIRQIEVSTIKKLKELKEFTEQIEVAEHNVNRLLENYGGVMEENHLINELLTYADMNPTNRQASLFILSNLLNDKLHLVKSDKDVHTGWKLPTFPLDTLKQTLNELTDIINNENRLLKTEELLNIFKSRESFENHRQQLTNLFGVDLDNKIDKFLNSYLIISKKLNQNILGEWGLSHWNTVSPKRMGDKVYLVLRKTGKPLHFTEISDLINQTGFDKKVAYPATIHNELILDDRYILIGRGIYALKEWGYKSGTVIDIMVDILSKSDKPLTKEEVIEKVLEQRVVRKSTILLALTNKEKVKKLPDGRYTINTN
ncbi:MAG: hypothetical protein A3J62_00495 [Candidatus Buchananbacteria bacterium RIFCSPHIGHO2_02_FULL_38_8]|uniref:HTH HARE-type domain-containing protein n=2 Tax=Candidatus Buchananiibacteriota TaxID=1817903 RepID=A0A1G1XVQ9_9BACT|nr:hypothetical protein [uncultured bacterium]OGY44118.1 MAG: hypothetical protein A2731_02900 [Candidatus Buchananbacteria bacterium RIFCSPHIGHO2_01_FULL_39_8]OGY47338.1 MAG: hypothetical protein A3J62_00495 [Candidatus Buchananbacteria bacterium RIFCSPHIGHO2_02_FULL_38_8]